MSEPNAIAAVPALLHRLRAVAISAVAAAGLAGCASSGLTTSPTPSLAPADAPADAARSAAVSPLPAIPRAAVKPVPVALASLIGAPAPISGKLTKKLESALQRRNISVVKSAAAYKVKGIVSALSEKKGAKVAYIWDIDSGGKRAHRIAGEAIVAGGKPGDAWSGVGDKVLDDVADETAGQIADWMSKNNSDYVAGTGAGGSNSAQSLEKLRANRVAAVNATASDASPAAQPVKRDQLVMVGSVTGAPSDGGPLLTKALRNRLHARGVKLTSQASDVVYQVRGMVNLGEVKGDQQAITISWNIYSPNGKRIDGVEQKNTLPTSAINGSWSQIAEMAAESATEFIILNLTKSYAGL